MTRLLISLSVVALASCAMSMTDWVKAVKIADLKGVQTGIDDGLDVNSCETSKRGNRSVLLEGVTSSFDKEQMARHTDVVNMLLKAGADPSLICPEGYPPINHAIDKLQVEQLEALIDAGADVTWTDEYGFNLLHRAVKQDCLECARLLLAAGADPSAKDQVNHQSPAALANMEGTKEMAALFAGDPGQSEAADGDEATTEP